MKFIYLLLVCFLYTLNSFSQQISVKSFIALPKDLDARVNYPKTDQNGETCAIIKVETSENDFSWESDQLGIVKAERKVGEYWLYVPHGAKKLTIKHDKLGILRDYHYPEPIKEACCYELKLNIGTINQIVHEAILGEYIVIKAEPSTAQIFIDDTLKGNGEINLKLKLGKHTYRVEDLMYETQVGIFELVDKKVILEFKLKPDFGYLNIISAPVNGAKIFIDKMDIGKSTPLDLFKLKPGKHFVEVKMNYYQSKGKEIVVNLNQTSIANFEMEPNFAEIQVNSMPLADIFINEEKRGFGNWSGKLTAGSIYTIEARKEGYHSAKTDISIRAGKTETIKLELIAKKGNLDISTNIPDAKVEINGKDYGKTPLILKNELLEGEYTLKLSLEGFSTIEKKIVINEGVLKEIKEVFPESGTLTIHSNPAGVNVLLDGDFIGKTPLNVQRKYGKLNLSFSKNKYISQNIKHLFAPFNNKIEVNLQPVKIFNTAAETRRKSFIALQTSILAPYGFSIGNIGEWGYLLKLKFSPYQPSEYTCNKNGIVNDLSDSYLEYTGKQTIVRGTFMAGFSRYIGKGFYMFLNAGPGFKNYYWEYLRYKNQTEEYLDKGYAKNTFYSYNSLEMETGLIFNYKYLFASFGVSNFNLKDTDINLMIGVAF